MTPVYIEDIVEGWTSELQAEILQAIKANETAALGATLMTGIRYSKSSFDELIETLIQAEAGQAKYTKYPLVHLVQDMPINRGEQVGIFGSVNMNLILIHQTVNTYKIDDRDLKVFKPVLWPMYYALLDIIAKSKWVFGSDATTGGFRHTVIKHAFWGDRNLQGSKIILNDYVDAIEIRNLQIKFNFNNC